MTDDDMPRTDDLATILERIPAFAGRRFEGLAVARLASLTNRTYRIGVGADAVVLRIAGEGTERYIDRAAEAHNAGLAASIGIAPEVVFADARSGVMVTRFIADGMALTPKRLWQRGMLLRAVALLRRLHDSGLPFSSHMDLLPKLDEYVSLASKRHWPGDLDPAAIARHADAARAALERNRGPQVPSHIDPVPDNFVAAGGGSTLHLLDWEYSAMCEPMWDLAALSIEAELHAKQDDILLAAYFPTVTAAESRRFVLYKGMLNLMAAAWALVQVADENPNADFAAFARDRLARYRAVAESAAYRACIAAA
jgi:thiamine kinase-like enzyme